MMWKLMALVAALALTGALEAVESRESPMTPERLQEVIAELAGPIEVQGNVLGFSITDLELYCIFDPAANRMRIISPIAPLTEISPEHLVTALAANYHTALDARYAMADGIMYSVFIHPLSPLTDDELRSAIMQVVRANQTFGTSFSSTDLSFGLPQAAPEDQPDEKGISAQDAET